VGQKAVTTVFRLALDATGFDGTAQVRIFVTFCFWVFLRNRKSRLTQNWENSFELCFQND
jgi:hypothetical protein